MSDATDAEALEKGELSSALSDAGAEVAKERTHVLRWGKASDDSMAADTTSETMVASAPFAGTVQHVYVTFDGTITADNNDYATITVSKYTAAGGSKTAIATAKTKLANAGGIGDVTAKVRYAFTLVNAAIELQAGAALTFEIAKTGSGVVVPKGLLEVHMKRTG